MLMSTQKSTNTIDDFRIAAFLGLTTKEVRKMIFHAARVAKQNGVLKITLEHEAKKFHINCANVESLDVILDYFVDFNERVMAGQDARHDAQADELIRIYPKHRIASDLATRLMCTEAEPYYK